MPEPASTEAPAPGANGAPGSSGDHYTGVVVIHGLGIIRRSSTLEEAVNSLAHWFNHQAGLALRREGPGRVWVAAQLTDDPNPDAPAAQASLHLAAPGAAAPSAGDDGLRLEFREVWWAESFGVPSLGATIAWARVQAWEQATHLLLPIGRRLGPAYTAARTPAREIPQATTYRPMRDGPPDQPPPKGMAASAAGPKSGADTSLGPLQRTLLTGALGLYMFMQYLWKALQWLILTPLILALLLVMGLLRLLTFIAPLRSSIVASISAVLDTIMLHWIAEAQVYTLDYTRSAGIRGRFTRELEAFLRDDRCDRIMVVAHSMGTVIAYEGLTTVLNHPDFAQSQKPVTFVCLAAALRRVWLMTPDDPHRLRGVLPARVRWLHFWAHYDPVAAGPLDARSLPRVTAWADPSVPNPQATLSARLDRCENVDVVNTDSTFADHATYWENLEQVVGPIARELVAGHPALERAVQDHLATPDEVLLHRWRVAWRSTVALVGGFGLGLALLIWDSSQQWMRIGHTLATSVLKLIGDLLGTVATGFSTILVDFERITSGVTGSSGPPVSVDLSFLPADIIWSVIAALLVAAAGILLIGKLVAARSPLAFDRGSPANGNTTASILVLAAGYLALPFIGRAIYYAFSSVSATTATVPVLAVLEVLADLCGAGAFIFAFLSAVRRQLDGWGATMVLLTVPFAFLVADFILVANAIVPTAGGTGAAARAYQSYTNAVFTPAFAGAVIGIAGCLYALRRSLQRRSIGGAIVLLVLAVVLTWTAIAFATNNLLIGPLGVSPASFTQAATAFFKVSDQIVFVGLFMPVLVYALVTGVGSLAPRRAAPARTSGIVMLAVSALVLLNVLILTLAVVPPPLVAGQVAEYGAVAVVALVSLAAIGQTVIQAVTKRQWGWLAGLVLVIAAVSFVATLIPSSTHPAISTAEELAGLICAGPSAAALIYGLWGAPAPATPNV